MGTNYYMRHNICDKCKRYDEEHIGKSSAGWTFSFHATEDTRSYKQWLDRLRAKDVKIYNEYDEEITIDEFRDIVEDREPSCKNHAKEYPDKYHFVDADGNSFSEYDFS